MEKKINIDKNHGYYLPLFNLKGLKSSITPFFGGDLKLDHHHYAIEPTTEVSLFQNNLSRNVIFTVDGRQYFLNGQTSHQQKDTVTVSVGPLYQIVERKNALFKLTITSYVPVDDNLEVHQIVIENISNEAFNIDVVTAVPIYARSADNLRDHRHVTALLNRIKVYEQGVSVKPTLSFDERGHLRNEHIYSVFANIDGVKVNRKITNVDDFLDGGSFSFPKGIYQKDSKVRQGYEAIGAIGFEPFDLKPNEHKTLTLTIGIHDSEIDVSSLPAKYFNEKNFQQELLKTKQFFEKYIEQLNFEITNEKTSDLLKWVTIQPVLRRYFGNSYLPHHDYGRGGRGWRDLWQDLLALIMFNESSVKDLLYNNFAGVRIDGSNATIIGSKPGEFVADRNKIVRVWSDHGAWPLLTTKMYIDETGDLDFLFEKQYYFDDQFTHYTKQTKSNIAKDHILKNQNESYRGTVLEHLLLQNIVAHKNIGAHGFVRLEDADWNDGLDMAHGLGETIAFTHFYANNLKLIAALVKEANQDIYVFKSLHDLIFDKMLLSEFYNQVASFDEEIVLLDKEKLILKLTELYEARIKHLNSNAWIKDTHLQSYINNDGEFSDNEQTMSLTGQAMALLSETLDKADAKKIADTTKKMLYDSEIGGYRLNSDYDAVLYNMGRAYGFAYGHKENGAMFSHMSLMYIYGLYNYDLVDFGHQGYMTLINRSLDKSSNVLAGIPEYFNDRGIGKYVYLTGSATWLLKLLRDQIFGIKLNLGKLTLQPKLTKDEFIDAKATIHTVVKGKALKVTYINEKGLDYGKYAIKKVTSKGIDVTNDLASANEFMEVYLDEV